MHPTFGRYELLKRLAGGGMGEVYLARQRGLDGFSKLLVIKTLLPHLCEDEEFITMFKDEARLTAQLIHPNICQVFEFDQVDGTFYIAMEYLRGEDLRRLFRACEQKGKPLRVPLICRIIADAAAGLDFAHSLRDGNGEPFHIVHRDISPQNILVTFEGGVKVIDFGVAKAAGRAQHTRTGALKGKYSYMSPEQVGGKEIDGRTDIFALGIVLHELLTGKRLFKADSDVETLERVRQTKVPPPSSLNPQIPQSLDGIVMHALTQDPKARFQTAGELRLALEDWLIQGRMAASNAHLGEFLKVIYSERLEKEARLGPLLGDPGLSVMPDQLGAGGTPHPGSSTPSGMKFAGPAPMGSGSQPGSVNQRPISVSNSGGGLSQSTDGKSQIDLSQINTESGAHPFKKSSAQLPIAIGVGVAAIALALVVVLKSKGPVQPPQPAVALLTVASDPAGAALSIDDKPEGNTPATGLPLHEGQVRLHLALEGYQPVDTALQLTAGPNSKSYKLEKSAPQKVTVQLESDPSGAEITDGPMIIGKAPKFWQTTVGKHELTFTLPGYQETVSTVMAERDQQNFNIRLKKLEQARPTNTDGPTTAPPVLGAIKDER